MIRRTLLWIGLSALTACGALPLPGRAPAVDPGFAALAQAGAPRLQVGLLSQRAGTVVVRDTVRDGYATWVSQDGASLTLNRGMLVATRGLGGDMLGSDVSEPLAIVLQRSPGRVTRFHTFLDGENRPVRRAYICDIEDRGPRELTFGAATLQTRLIGEDCASQDQTFLNLYWIDGTGQIVQSRQWAGDFAGILTFRIVP